MILFLLSYNLVLHCLHLFITFFTFFLLFHISVQKLPPIIFSDIDHLPINFNAASPSLLPNTNGNSNENDKRNITNDNKIEEHSFGSKNEEYSTGVVAVPIGESYSLLDWGDESPPLNTHTPTHTQAAHTQQHTQQSEKLQTAAMQDMMMLATTTSATTFNTTSVTSSLRLLVLKPAAEQQLLVNPQIFQELWTTSRTIFDGYLNNNLYENAELNYISARNILQRNVLLPNENIFKNDSNVSITSIETIFLKNLIMVMASGANAPSNQKKLNLNQPTKASPDGFKFFLYGVEEENFLLGIKGSIFLAQLIFIPAFEDFSSQVIVTIKVMNTNEKNNLTNISSTDDGRFGDLILKALSELYVL